MIIYTCLPLVIVKNEWVTKKIIKRTNRYHGERRQVSKGGEQQDSTEKKN
jgi:hypothetical protein